MLKKTRTFRLIALGTAIGSGAGVLLIVVSLFMIYTGRGMGSGGTFLIPVGVIVLLAALVVGGKAFYIFRQRWEERQLIINQSLVNEGITIAIAPRSATMDDPKDVGIWRRLAIILNRASDYPDQHLSWEVAGSRDRLVFIMRIPGAWQRAIAGEINREFPEAEITVFPNNPKDIVASKKNVYLDPPFEAVLNEEKFLWQSLRLSADSAYPLFTGETRIDQMTALLSAVNNVNPQAHVGYQFLIRRALADTGQRWNATAQKMVPQPKPGTPTPKISDETRKLVKAIEDRARQPAFEIEIRCWASSTDQKIAAGELQRIVQALMAETVTSGPYNQLSPGQQGAEPEPILFRAFPNEPGAVLTATELGNFLHLPGKKGVEPYPKLMTATAKKLPPAPPLVINEGDMGPKRILGHFDHSTGDTDTVGQPFLETRKHTLIIGPTGSGKSVLMTNNIIADFTLNDSGVLVIEPSGDVPADLVAGLPPEFLNDVVLLNPRDSQPFAVNMCAVGIELGLAAAVQNAVGAIQLAMGANWSTAVRMQQLIINGLYVIMDVLNRPDEEGASMVALGRFLQNVAYRERLVERTSLQATGAKAFWLNDFANWSEKEQQESVSVAMRRLSGWIGNPEIRRTLGLPYRTIDLANLLGGPIGEANPRPKLVLLPLHPRMGKDTKALIGALVVNYFVSVMLLREEIPRDKRRTAALHIDEFKNFVNTSGADDIEILLAECRKYGAATSLYTQGQRQLSQSILVETDINTLTKIFYGLSDPKEVRIAAGQLAGAVDSYDLMNMPEYHAYVKVGQNSPTLLKMLPPAHDNTASPPPRKGFRERPLQEWNSLAKDTEPFSRFAPNAGKNGHDSPPDSLERLTAPELLRWAYRLQKTEPDTLVRQLAAMPDAEFEALQETRRQFDQWRAAEVADNPGLIPNRLQRIAWRSRWLYGIPSWESDATYLRMTNQGSDSEASESLEEDDSFGSW